MTNNEVETYQRNAFAEMREKISFSPKRADIYETAEYIILLLLSRATLFGTVNPFAVAFFAASFPKQKKVYGIVFACLSILLGNFGVLSLKYMGTVAIFTAFSLLLRKELAQKPLLYALIVSAANTANGMIYIFFDGMLLYDILKLILESSAIFLSYFAFSRAAALLRTLATRKVLENEETLSLVLLAAAVFLSLASFPGGTVLAHTLAVLAVMILALTNGAAVSAMGGTLLGLVLSAADVLPAQVVGVYAVCALVCGFARKYGKWGVSIGFFLTNAAVMLYFNSSLLTFIAWYDILAASVLLFVLPQHWLALFGTVARTPWLHAEDDPVTRTKEILNSRLEDAENSFRKLSDIFGELISEKTISQARSTDRFFEKTVQSVCKNCSMNRYCWQKNEPNNRNISEMLLPIMQERGHAADIDFPKSFRSDCLHFSDFLTTLNRNYEIHKVNLMWAGKVSESRNLVTEQFRSIASVLKQIRLRLRSDISEDMRLENKIAAALDRKGISADRICVSNADGYEVSMTAAACGGEHLCSTLAASAVSEALGVPMLRTQRNCGETVCRLRFREQERFCVDIGLAQLARNKTEPSGDNCCFQLLADGKYILALSDGMGSGTRASLQSNIALELIKRLLEAGFDKETALKLMNNVLLAGNDESFATMDLCLMNLYTGALEFLKTGAAYSYLKSTSGISRIRSSSLPSGIVEHAEADCELRYAQNGDFIILATDGVTDILERGGEDKADAVLQSLHANTAQGLAEQILTEALRLSNGKLRDDMTVLCAQINEVM